MSLAENVDIQLPLEIATPSEPPKRNKSQWKFVLMLVVSLALILIFNFYKPAKFALFEIGRKIKALGWFGYAVLILIDGCIVMPLALPYIIFEMLIAILIPHYWRAVLLCLASNVLGWSIIYYITKRYLRARFMTRLRQRRFYRGIELLLARNPFRFSIIARIINIPFWIKNYGLALPESIGFTTYLISAIIGTVPEALVEIYLFQRIQHLDQFMDDKKGATHRTITVIMIIASIGCIIYILWYTRKVLKEIHEKGQNPSSEININANISQDFGYSLGIL